jgi:hypothetical protein
MFGNKVRRKIFGPERSDVSNFKDDEEFSDLHRSSRTVMMVKWRTLCWAAYVARMEQAKMYSGERGYVKSPAVENLHHTVT